MDACATPGVGTVSLSIASDAIALPHSGDSIVSVDTESAAATDSLQNITGGTRGQVITLAQANSARDVTIVTGGNISIVGNYVMASTLDTITLFYNGSAWVEVSRSSTALIVTN